MSLRWQSLSTQVLAVTWVVAAGTAVAACQSAPPLLSPTPLGNPEASASLSEERCVNVAADGIALLGGVVLPNGTVGFGGMWVPVVLGGVSGEMASVVVGEDASGQHGAVHLTLEHADEPEAHLGWAHRDEEERAALRQTVQRLVRAPVFDDRQHVARLRARELRLELRLRDDREDVRHGSEDIRGTATSDRPGEHGVRCAACA